MEEMTQESVLRLNALRYGGYLIPYWEDIDPARTYLLADCRLRLLYSTEQMLVIDNGDEPAEWFRLSHNTNQMIVIN